MPGSLKLEGQSLKRDVLSILRGLKTRLRGHGFVQSMCGSGSHTWHHKTKFTKEKMVKTRIPQPREKRCLIEDCSSRLGISKKTGCLCLCTPILKKTSFPTLHSASLPSSSESILQSMINGSAHGAASKIPETGRHDGPVGKGHLPPSQTTQV